MFCPKCGRLIKRDLCVCLKSNKINRVETGLITLVLMGLPIIVIVRSAITNGLDNVNYVLLVNIVLSVVLVLLSLFSKVMGKSYTAMFFSCHQRIDRSCKFDNHVMNICSRCFGIYSGIIFSIPLSIVFQSNWMLVLVIPMILDGIMQYKTKYESNNIKRYLSGVLFGFGFVYIFALYNYYICVLLNWLLPIVNIS